MKNKIILAMVALCSIALIYACGLHDGHNVKPNLNINYSAAFVVNGQDGDIDVIKLSDYSHTDHISLNGASFPHHIYLNPDKTKMAIAITSTDLSGGHGGHSGTVAGLKVMIVNTTTGATEKEIALTKLPHNAIFSPSGTELWLGQSDETESSVLVYQVSDWGLKHTIKVGKGLSEVTFSKDGSTVFAANTESGTVSVIDPMTKTVTKTLTVGQDPVGAWAASNGFMYVDNETSQTISEISVAEKKVVQTIDLGFKPAYVAYNSLTTELWVTDATNGKVVFFKKVADVWVKQSDLATGNDAHAIVFSEDEKMAYITNQGANTVSVIQSENHQILKTIAVGKKPNGIVLK